MKNKIIASNNLLQNQTITIPIPDSTDFQYLFKGKNINEKIQALQQSIQTITDSEGNLLSNIKDNIQQVLENIEQKFGLGMALVFLHANGVANKYLQQSTSTTYQGDKFKLSHIPIRDIRSNLQELSKRGILLENNNELKVMHSGKVCFFCSAPRLNAKELLINTEIDGTTYQGGFTFAPFGNPLEAFHLVMWQKVDLNKTNRSDENLTIEIPVVPRMDYTNTTVSHLVELTHNINSSISRNFDNINKNSKLQVFGLFNSWAGNSIEHQHFQFAALELPITKAQPLLHWRDTKGTIAKLDWPTDAYMITADSRQNLKDLSKTIIDKWMSLTSINANLSLNLICMPSVNGKYTLYLIPRDIAKKDYINNGNDTFFGLKIPDKKNIAGLETAGYLLADGLGDKMKRIIDDLKDYENYCVEVDKLVSEPLKSIKPDNELISRFEAWMDNNIRLIEEEEFVGDPNIDENGNWNGSFLPTNYWQPKNK